MDVHPIPTAPGIADAIAPFVDGTAIAIVVGGTVIATLLRSPMNDTLSAVAALPGLARRRFRVEPLVEQAGALVRIARRHGVLELDRSIITDPEIDTAVEAAITGRDGVEIVDRVAAIRGRRLDRALDAAEFWNGVAEVAPAMGMIGTLIGLVRMFMAMQDVEAIGAAMAVALLTTLYGAVIANLIALPIASRLRRAAEAEASARRALDPLLARLAVRRRQPIVKSLEEAA